MPTAEGVDDGQATEQIRAARLLRDRPDTAVGRTWDVERWFTFGGRPEARRLEAFRLAAGNQRRRIVPRSSCVAHDAGILHRLLDLRGVWQRRLFGSAVEGAAEVFCG
jgi:hypothetical protein